MLFIKIQLFLVNCIGVLLSFKMCYKASLSFSAAFLDSTKIKDWKEVALDYRDDHVLFDYVSM